MQDLDNQQPSEKGTVQPEDVSNAPTEKCEGRKIRSGYLPFHTQVLYRPRQNNRPRGIHRWELLNREIKLKFTFNSLSQTRWSCHYDAFEVFKDNYVGVLGKRISKAGISVIVFSLNSRRECEASSCASNNGTSVTYTQSHAFWIKDYRQTGFGKCFSDACMFIDKISYDLPKDFKNKRVAKKKRMFDYEGGDQPVDSVINLQILSLFSYRLIL
ncbi:hypothetical protein TNCV_2973471 [Trichonephila clavipes]|nr:hypothetical protein TNCV_2973471 [Trichonephila clavipes]